LGKSLLALSLRHISLNRTQDGLVLTFIFVQRIERSWMGLAMDAIRIDETAAACFGTNIICWKITAFTIGNFVIGVAGALYSMMLSYINPSNFTFSDSLLFLSILLLGGIDSIWSVIAVTAFMVVIPEKFQVIQEYRYLIYSALVLTMIVFRPSGLLLRKPRTYLAGGLP
jgi:ABC-type branched-subunit amino acid transport system permease subunit